MTGQFNYWKGTIEQAVVELSEARISLSRNIIQGTLKTPSYHLKIIARLVSPPQRVKGQSLHSAQGPHTLPET